MVVCLDELSGSDPFTAAGRLASSYALKRVKTGFQARSKQEISSVDDGVAKVEAKALLQRHHGQGRRFLCRRPARCFETTRWGRLVSEATT